MESKETNEVRNFLIGFGIGVGLGLLFAPRSGSELRDDISTRARNAAESARERFHRLRRKVETEMGDLKTQFR